MAARSSVVPRVGDRASGALMAQLGTSVASILVMLAAVAAVAVTALIAGGMRAQVQYSGDLAPQLHAGDLALVKQTGASLVKPGDVVGLRGAFGDLAFTRVTSVSAAADGEVLMLTSRGAQTTPERWSFPAGGSVLHVRGRIPAVGSQIKQLAVPAGGLLLLLLGCGLAVTHLRGAAARD